MISFFIEIDLAILFFIQNTLQNGIMDKIMPWITFLGDRGLIWILISLALILNKKTRYIGILTLAAIVLSTLLGEGILKNLVQRQRPFVADPSIQLLIKPLTSFSFPSGHTGSSFAAAGVLGQYIKKYRIWFFGFASLVAFSRLYLYVHYASDVFIGIALGLLCSRVVIGVYGRTDK